MSRPRVLIVDDHKVVVEGLVRLLGEHFEIVGTIIDGRLVLESVSRLQPDVILLDISMPHLSGLGVMRQLRTRGIYVKVIVLTMHVDASLAVEALKMGAAGYVVKESSGEELVKAVHVVLAGGTYLASRLTKEVVTLMSGGVTDPSRVELSTQQREVLRLLVRGHRAKEIAANLDISTRSVETIKYKTMQLLNIHSTAELVRYVVEHGLVTFCIGWCVISGQALPQLPGHLLA
jgi:DNA-binding NarL/FixJ family response regulator